MRLIIAEKPSVAQAIADVIGGGKKLNGFIDIPSAKTKVTWCYGHLLEQLAPEAYVPGGKVLASHLPVLPTEFKLEPREKAAAQVKVIKELLKEASEVVNAGDADREGQLLVDELFPYLGWKGKTSRLWLSSLDVESVKLALAKIKPNADYKKIYESALGRSHADWLVSLNCSIALSRNLQAMGVAGSWSIGRVQTPTLALMVDRQTEIKAFTKKDHYSVCANLAQGIRANWLIPEDLLIDGLLLDKTSAESVALAITGQNLTVEKFESKPGTRAAPMPYTLGALQTAANQHGFSASETLAAAQTLYEAKLTTYPRTDCAYLPVELHTNATHVLTALGAIGGKLKIDSTQKHSAWNTAKVEAHHGIIPTGVSPDSVNLSSKARQLFDLIADSYVRLFMPPEAFVTREAVFKRPGNNQADASDLIFQAKSRVVTDRGWTALTGTTEDEAVDSEAVSAELPTLEVGQSLQCECADIVAKATKPAKPHNDGTLIAAMKSVYKLITDPQLKLRLKETSGLGTEATRAGMIEVLITRGYIERQSRNLIATDRGIQLIEWLRSNEGSAALTNPGTTALQEDALADIASGRLLFADFMGTVVDSAKSLCKVLLDGQFVDASTLTLHTCPACGGERCAAQKSKAGNKYHKCLDCQVAFADDNGKPGKQFEERKEGDAKPAAATGPKCPPCKKPTFVNETKTDKLYFRCGSCKTAWWPDKDSDKKLGTKWLPR